MAWWGWLVLALVVGALLLGAGLLYRLREVRRAGTPVILRALPAESDRGWRHGSVHYTEYALVYYRLSALLPGPTLALPRGLVEVRSRRSPEGTEAEIMDPDVVVLQVHVSGTGPSGGDYEIAMAPILVTALSSWLESRPPRRSRRRGARD